MPRNEDTAQISARVRHDTLARLDDLAAAAGIRRGQLVGELLEEMVPKIATVAPRRGLAIELHGDPDASPNRAAAEAMDRRAGAGEPS